MWELKPESLHNMPYLKLRLHHWVLWLETQCRPKWDCRNPSGCTCIANPTGIARDECIFMANLHVQDMHVHQRMCTCPDCNLFVPHWQTCKTQKSKVTTGFKMQIQKITKIKKPFVFFSQFNLTVQFSAKLKIASLKIKTKFYRLINLNKKPLCFHV